MKVRVNATREDLHRMGICSENTFNMLLSDKVFTVKRRHHENGRVMVYLDVPGRPDHSLWVYEEFTEEVKGADAS